MGLQAAWYVAQWGFAVAAINLVNMLFTEDRWFDAPIEVRRIAAEKRRNGEKPNGLYESLYYTVDMAWWAPIALYAVAMLLAVVGVIVFVSEEGVGNDLTWFTHPAPLASFILLSFWLAEWIPWFYRTCYTRCTEQYLRMALCSLASILLMVWFFQYDIIAGSLMIPLAVIVTLIFMFVFISERRCKTIDKPQYSLCSSS